MNNSGMSSKIVIAKWKDRFLAWLINFIIISVILAFIFFASIETIDYEFEDNFWTENMQYIPTSIMFFTYWTILEYKTGQSIGKKSLI